VTKKGSKKNTSSENGEKPKTMPTSARLLRNRPLDPASDDVDVRPSQPANPVFAEAIKNIPGENIEEPKQRELLASPEAATKPLCVQNGRMLATYVGLGLERDKEGEKLIHLDFSLPLNAEHDGHLPAKIKEAYDWIVASGNKAVQVIDIPAQTMDIYSDPKEKKSNLHLGGAAVTKAIISIVEQVGKGKAVQVIRFAFRVLVERDEEVLDFATQNDGLEFWITTHQTQGKLL
jgi:hypothetical protein